MSKLFPKSANRLPLQIVIYLLVLGGIVTAATTYYATPKYTRVGYTPVQPVEFSHALHAGNLGIDCRYCHSNVDKSAHSNIPTSQTCMNCHSIIKASSPQLEPVRTSFASGDPVPWVNVHVMPNYVYFNHSVHVTRGVSCVECHGRIDQMEVVRHEKPLSMGFCLDCHRAPEKVLRSPELVTKLDWVHPQGAQGQIEQGKKFVHDWNVQPPQSCSGCHR
ncbi:MAG: cytochrome c3 family protein [Opitutaceae bacterium]|nr:cytochrome c3 family protein [Opitutaceae bacterium]